jgi:hypothetical protein
MASNRNILKSEWASASGTQGLPFHLHDLIMNSEQEHDLSEALNV